jgi:predicted transposase/invertase (TIGR01784 family)
LYYDPDTGVPFVGKTRIITVELVKTKHIVDKPAEEMTDAEAWAVFFQYLTDECKSDKIIEIINREEGIAMAVETLVKVTKDEIEYARMTTLLKSELDWQSRETNAKKSGLNEGLQKGYAKANLENTRKMKAMGFLAEQIQAVTGLSTDTIAQL